MEASPKGVLRIRDLNAPVVVYRWPDTVVARSFAADFLLWR